VATMLAPRARIGTYPRTPAGGSNDANCRSGSRRNPIPLVFLLWLVPEKLGFIRNKMRAAAYIWNGNPETTAQRLRNVIGLAAL